MRTVKAILSGGSQSGKRLILAEHTHAIAVPAEIALDQEMSPLPFYERYRWGGKTVDEDGNRVFVLVGDM